MLEIKNLSIYHGAVAAVLGISFQVGQGELTAILGANGAGKSSTLLAIAGALTPTKGQIILDGKDVTSSSPEKMVRAGVAMTPETRDIFPDLTVDENLRLGAYTRLHDKKGVANDFERMFELFPILRERLTQPAGTLSGGEQQMLVIARAMMSRPSLLLLDEPSLGLAPTIVDHIFQMISELKKEGITIILVEQNAAKALSIADHAFVMRQGTFAASGTASEIAANPNLGELYLGEGK